MKDLELAQQFIQSCEMNFNSAPDNQKKVIICITPEQLIQIGPGIIENLIEWSQFALPYVVFGPVLGFFASELMGVKTLLKQRKNKESIPAKLLKISKFFLSPDFARENMEFDLNHPISSTVYMENPCDKNHYVLPALINERLAQEKLAAFLQIAQSLGARKITIESGEIVGNKSSLQAKFPLPKIAAQIGLAASFENEHKVDRKVCWEFNEPNTKPQFSEQYHFWLHTDPLLRALVESRERGGVRHSEVCLNVHEMMDTAADITVQCAKLKLQAGGEHRRVQASKWLFDIEFW